MKKVEDIVFALANNKRKNSEITAAVDNVVDNLKSLDLSYNEAVMFLDCVKEIIGTVKIS